MVSQRDDAIRILVEMLNRGEDRDRIQAADKLLRSSNMPRHHIEASMVVLRSIMDDDLAEPRDRVSAADKLKNFDTPRTESARDMARILAAKTDGELQEMMGAFKLPDLASDPDVVLAADPLLQ